MSLSTPQKTLQEIESEFKNSLDVPQEKPRLQIFFCPVGLIGAGKTTITKPISESLNLLRISADEIRKLLKENGYSYEPLKQICFSVIHEFALTGFSISFDMDCGNPKVIEFVEKLAVELNAKLILVNVEASEEYIFKKFKKHPPS